MLFPDEQALARTRGWRNIQMLSCARTTYNGARSISAGRRCAPCSTTRRRAGAPTGGRSLRTTSAAALTSALVLLVAAPATAAKPNPGQFLTSSASRKLVHLTLLAGLGTANNGFNFDGYGRGELQVRVPLGWRVVVDCENRGSLRHSCAIVKGSLAATPAFHGASTKQPSLGLFPGAKATFSFTAARTGTFRIACLVPGHEQARMWDVLVVARGGRPSISARPGP
jgi:hypothetical protein